MKYAALITEYTHVEGDERSRTHPGHGYPAHTIESTTMLPFASRSAMEKWVHDVETSKYSSYKGRYRLIEYQDLTVAVTTSVTVK